jgi:glyoxylase-like metal-dependent hydrolase (beta-lactamase superfamily II)
VESGTILTRLLKVRLTSGSLAVFSPVALTPDVKKKIAELGGTMRYIVAPDIEHHIFLSEWAREFPEAKLVGPEGLQEKRAKAKDERIGQEPFATVFEAKTKLAAKVDEEFDRDFGYEYVDAHPNKELVFLYRPDRVLIQADLIFNLPPTEQYSRVPDAQKPGGITARLFTSVQSTRGEAKGLKRFLWYALSARDRKGFNESMARIDKWDFDTIIPCHGDVIQGDGKQVFEKVMEWHLAGAKAQEKA